MFFFIFLLCHWNFLPLKVISRLFSSFFVVVSALYRLPKNLPYVCGYVGASCFKNLVGMRRCLYLAGIRGQQTFLKTQKSGFSFKEKKKKKPEKDLMIWFPKQCQFSSCFLKRFSSLVSVIITLLLASCQLIGAFSPLPLSSVFGNMFTIRRTENNPTIENRQTAFCFTVEALYQHPFWRKLHHCTCEGLFCFKPLSLLLR